MLVDRAILNFVQLVELPFENHEVSASLGVEVDHVLLEFLQSVNDLEEVLVGQEEPVVSDLNLLDDCFNRV